MTQIRVPGRPVAFARPGQTPEGKRYTPEGYRDWKELAVAHMRMVNRVPRLGDVPVSVMIGVRSDHMTIDIVETSSRHYGRPKGIRGDLDNYVKAALDAAQDAGWIDDDRQVVAVVAHMVREEQ